jgi:hypothetical protein
MGLVENIVTAMVPLLALSLLQLLCTSELLELETGKVSVVPVDDGMYGGHPRVCC